jgi:hypothetical protein
MNYNNDKLNEIYRDTWPNLGWAKMKDDAPWLDTTYDGFMTHEEMLEEAERREVANRELQKEEWERKERSDTVLRRYNAFYNEECSGMPHGTPITPEHMQAMALECMIDALRCENMNVEYDVIAIDDIKDLIARLYQQSNEYLKRVQEFKDSADGVA